MTPLILSQFFNMEPSAFRDNFETKFDQDLVKAVLEFKNAQGDLTEKKYEVLTLVYKRNSVIEKVCRDCLIRNKNLQSARLAGKPEEVVKRSREEVVKELSSLFNMDPSAFHIETKYDYDLVRAANGYKHYTGLKSSGDYGKTNVGDYSESQLDDLIQGYQSDLYDLVNLRNRAVPNSCIDI